MLRRICLLLVAVLIAGAAGYAIYYCNPTPERLVIRQLDRLQRGKIKAAERCSTSGLGLDSSNRHARKLYKAMYHSMRFAVIDKHVDDTSAQIRVTVTMVDMEVQLAEASLQLLDGSLFGRFTSKKKMYRLLAEQIGGDDVTTTTNSATVQVVRDASGRWKIDSGDNDKYLAAITGGVGPF